MSYEAIAIIMFGSMMLMLLTGQRVFAAIGIVSTVAALLLWGEGGVEMPFTAAFKLFNLKAYSLRQASTTTEDGGKRGSNLHSWFVASQTPVPRVARARSHPL